MVLVQQMVTSGEELGLHAPVIIQGGTADRFEGQDEKLRPDQQKGIIHD